MSSKFSQDGCTGRLPHAKLMRSIEPYGSKVIPMVRDLAAASPGRLAS